MWGKYRKMDHTITTNSAQGFKEMLGNAICWASRVRVRNSKETGSHYFIIAALLYLSSRVDESKML